MPTELCVNQPISLIGNTDTWTPIPLSRMQLSARLRVTLNSDDYAAAAAVLRTAIDNITRETPLINILTPTNVPIAQAELDGHCM